MSTTKSKATPKEPTPSRGNAPLPQAFYSWRKNFTVASVRDWTCSFS